MIKLKIYPTVIEHYHIPIFIFGKTSFDNILSISPNAVLDISSLSGAILAIYFVSKRLSPYCYHTVPFYGRHCVTMCTVCVQWSRHGDGGGPGPGC